MISIDWDDNQPHLDDVLASLVHQEANVIRSYLVQTPAEQLAYAARFWARECLRLAELAALTAVRLRHRGADREVLSLYAYDDPNPRHDVAFYRAEWLGTAHHYDLLHARLVGWAGEGLHEAHAAITRLQQEAPK